jgi:hypothetical protein
MKKRVQHHGSAPQGFLSLCALILIWFVFFPLASLAAEDSVCARVKIEVLQELTLERQAFDAHMRINNGLTNIALENVAIDVSFSDKDGNPVRATYDPDDTSALFFIRVNTMENITHIDGQGAVPPSSSADIHWLIIPAPGAANGVTQGTLYYVGATLHYSIGGEPQETKVTPDYIFVKPMPEIVLDYFLPKDVYGDDAFTPEVEPIIPFSLGVRVSNKGHGTARNLKIDSAQPRIVENNQGLLVGFSIEGSEVNGQPGSRSLLVNFGDIPPEASGTARWSMTCTLSGKFVEFSADFSHADELGGEVTSLIDAVNTHFLLRDVLVDLPGRDGIRDFLAIDGDVLRVYESQSGAYPVMDQSESASLQLESQTGAQIIHTLAVPAIIGFAYVELNDPYQGQKVLKEVLRSDGKRIKPENAWLSKTRNDGHTWRYALNLFDVNSTGLYRVTFDDATSKPHPPELQPIPDRMGAEGRALSFTAAASDAGGTVPTLSAAPLPALATFIDQGNGQAVFEWTPTVGQAGQYVISFTASDGLLKVSQKATITICSAEDTDCDGLADGWEMKYFGTLSRNGKGDADGDGWTDLEEFQRGSDPTKSSAPTVPVIASPLDKTRESNLTPELVIQNSTDPDGDPVTYVFELYADKELNTLVASQSGLFAGSEVTAWTVETELLDHTWYTWRVRATDGRAFSLWTTASFFVNSANEPPGSFAVSSPQDRSEVDTAMPILQVSNSLDVDQEPLEYRFEVYGDAGMVNPTVFSDGIPPGQGGTTSWTVNVPLSEDTWYFWKAVVRDPHGATAVTPLTSFFVNTANAAPTAPLISSPTRDSEVTALNAVLVVSNATDADGDELTYLFELDRVETFDSHSSITSGSLPSGAGLTRWSVSDLADNTLYFWRAKASDGVAESPWAVGKFFVNTANDPPTAPTVKNPGDRAWVQTQTPALELSPSVDIDRDTLSYLYEVYADAALTTRVFQLEWESPRLVVPSPLADNTWYFWTAGARDGHGLASERTGVHSFFVNNNGYDDPPQLTLENPSEPIFTAAGPVLITWKDSDPDSNAAIALYYDTYGSGFNGTLLADGIMEDPDGPADSFLWDIDGVPDGTYHVYGTITDGTSTAAAYAPGTVTIDRAPPTAQASPRGGAYSSPQSVVLSSNEPARIYFTLDGTDPTSDSPCYGSPIPITKTATIRFAAVDRAGNQSGIMAEHYVIGETSGILVWGSVSNYPESSDCSKQQGRREGSLSLALTGPTSPSGWLWYVVTKPRVNLVSTKITEVTVAGSRVTVSGSAEVNNKRGYTFTAAINEGKKDSFGIAIRKPDGSIYYNAPLKPACEGKFWVTPLK